MDGIWSVCDGSVCLFDMDWLKYKDEIRFFMSALLAGCALLVSRYMCTHRSHIVFIGMLYMFFYADCNAWIEGSLSDYLSSMVSPLSQVPWSTAG